MAKTNNTTKTGSKNEASGKNTPKVPLHWYSDPRYKSVVNTIIFIIIAIIFFIVNNTRKEPESGPYPPAYKLSGNDSLVNKPE